MGGAYPSCRGAGYTVDRWPIQPNICMSLDCGMKLNFNHMFKDLIKTLYYKGVFVLHFMLPTTQRRKRIIRYVILTVSAIVRITAGWIHWTFSQNLEHLAQVSTCLKGQCTSPRSDSAFQKSSDGEAYHRSPSHLLFKSFVYKGSQSEKSCLKTAYYTERMNWGLHKCPV